MGLYGVAHYILSGWEGVRDNTKFLRNFQSKVSRTLRGLAIVG